MKPVEPVVPGGQRLFLALWPQLAVQREIATHLESWVWPPGCVPYARKDWHVTLHFLGVVPADQIGALSAAIQLRFQPFKWVLDRPQIWSRGMAVLGASVVPDELSTLHHRLQAVPNGLGRETDPRPFQPHLTLARHANGARIPARVSPVNWPVTGFALAVSTGETGRRYEIVRHYM